MKQRYLVGVISNPDEREEGEREEVTLETLGEESRFSKATFHHFVSLAFEISSPIFLTCVTFYFSS